jgi:FAD/FMN-containing dehydrogenase
MTDLSELRSALIGIVGEQGCLFDPNDTAPYCQDWRQMHRGRTPAVVRPASTMEVAAVVRWCAERRIPLVPQGGNTSLVDGATPSADGTEVVLSLARMNRIRDLDPTDLTLVIEAGATLKSAQEAALAQECLLPLSMGSEGSAQIGGMLSTNAGGNHAIRYGSARDLVLGLEVVLPDGQIWNGLRRLHKDNTGYCLRQLFVGAEGTLGIITAAVLKLVPRPREWAVAFCALPTVQAALDLLLACRRGLYDRMQAFEYVSGTALELVLKHIPGTQLPLAAPAGHYALIEVADYTAVPGARRLLEEALAEAMEAGLIADAAVANSSAERASLWRLREEQSEAQRREGASVKNDVSVPVSKVPQFLEAAIEVCERRFTGVRLAPFGHMGDGNIHFNVLPALGGDQAAFLRQADAIMATVNEVVREFDGSFSAEHGIGRLKPYLLQHWRRGPELEVMHRIKAALDPAGIMNPGKVLLPEKMNEQQGDERLTKKG